MLKSKWIIYGTFMCCTHSYAVQIKNLADDTAIYKAHVVSADSLNEGAKIIYNLKDVSSEKDVDNLCKILINLLITLAKTNKELANSNIDINNLQKLTDDARLITELGSNVLKIVLNDKKQSKPTFTEPTFTDQGLKKLFKDILTYKAISEANIPASSSFKVADLKEILSEILSNPSSVDNQVNKLLSTENSSLEDGLKALFKNLSEQIIQDTAVSSSSNLINIGLRDIFARIRDDKQKRLNRNN